MKDKDNIPYRVNKNSTDYPVNTSESKDKIAVRHQVSLPGAGETGPEFKCTILEGEVLGPDDPGGPDEHRTSTHRQTAETVDATGRHDSVYVVWTGGGGGGPGPYHGTGGGQGGRTPRPFLPSAMDALRPSCMRQIISAVEGALHRALHRELHRELFEGEKADE